LIIVRNENPTGGHSGVEELQAFESAFVKIDVQVNEREGQLFDRSGRSRKKALIETAGETGNVLLNAFEAAAIRAFMKREES